MTYPIGGLDIDLDCGFPPVVAEVVGVVPELLHVSQLRQLHELQLVDVEAVHVVVEAHAQLATRSQAWGVQPAAHGTLCW